jgi:8-oxo-dGTP pyrophosphatase MutT (NUDIX family)
VISKPRPSATVCVLYQGDAELEVLMVRRGRDARFMAGAWVFPGGAVDPEDHDPANLALLDGAVPGSDLGSWVAAAFREVVEETGVWLTDPAVVEPLNGASVYEKARRDGRRFPAGRVAYFANWVTPTMVPVRFDARFFMVAIAERVVPQPDEREVEAARFISPAEALRRAGTGEWLVPFPTRRTLHELDGIASVDEAIGEWRQRVVVSIRPRLRVSDDGALEVVMPGDPGFDDLDDAEPEPEVLAQAARVAAQGGTPVAEVAGDEH